MIQDTKVRPVHARQKWGLLRRLFGGDGDLSSGTNGHSQIRSSAALDLRDIQGFILRGYRMPMVRHFLLKVGSPAAARKLLGHFVNGDEIDAPQITTAADWRVGFGPGPDDRVRDAPRSKPDYCLNVGI